MSPSLLCALWMDRLQQNASFAVYNTSSSEPSTLAYELSMSTNTWWENYPMSSTTSGNAIIVQMPRPDQQRFVHLAILSIPTSGTQLMLEYLTEGSWDVTSIEYVAGATVVFAATISGPHLRQVYSVSTADRNVLNPFCVTCATNSSSCGKFCLRL